MMEEKKTPQLWFAEQGQEKTRKHLYSWNSHEHLAYNLLSAGFHMKMHTQDQTFWSGVTSFGALVLNVPISSAVISRYSFQAVMYLVPVIQMQPDPFFQFHKMNKLATVLEKKNTFVYW